MVLLFRDTAYMEALREGAKPAMRDLEEDELLLAFLQPDHARSLKCASFAYSLTGQRGGAVHA